MEEQKVSVFKKVHKDLLAAFEELTAEYEVSLIHYMPSVIVLTLKTDYGSNHERSDQKAYNLREGRSSAPRKTEESGHQTEETGQTTH